ADLQIEFVDGGVVCTRIDASCVPKRNSGHATLPFHGQVRARRSVVEIHSSGQGTRAVRTLAQQGLSGQGQRRGTQHSTMLTASPPRAVSLYLIFMSAPVCIMVLITLSRLTVCRPSPCSASRAAVIACTDPTAFLSMQGICTSPPTGSQVSPRFS